MKGCRAFTAAEFQQMCAALNESSNGLRNMAMFVMGCEMGPRISELLALKLGDVCEAGKIRKDVLLAKRLRKMKPESMWLPVPPLAAKALKHWVDEMLRRGWTGKDDLLFQGPWTMKRSIRPETARRIIKRAAKQCGLEGNISTHSMRKTFAQRIYQTVLRRKEAGAPMDPITETMQALGHKDPKNTMYYLGLSGMHTRELIMEAWSNEA